MGMITRIIVAAGLLFAGGTASASSPAVGNYTFDFVGICQDCESIATAHVVLHDYGLGTPINKDNFTSFTYDGTDLFEGYVMTLANVDFGIPSNIYGIHGLIGQLGGDPVMQPSYFEIVGSTESTHENVFFRSDVSGGWQTGVCCSIFDYGTDGTWTISASNALPEAATWAMMLMGFGAIGGTMRRRVVGPSWPLLQCNA